MIRTVDLRGVHLDKAGYQGALPRAEFDITQALALIEPILHRVQHGKESDLIALAEEFDGVRPPSIRVPEKAIDDALSALDPKIRTALEVSIERIRKVHNDQIRTDKVTTAVSYTHLTLPTILRV